MGILSFLKKIRPKGNIEKPVGVSQKKAVLTTGSKLGDQLLGLGIVAGAGSIAGFGVKAVLSTVSKVIPKTIKGKVIGAVTLPIAVGVISSAPKKVAETVVKAPSELAKFGADIGKVIADPSLESVKELVKESPLLTAGAVVLGVGAVAKATGLGGALLLGKALDDDIIVKTGGNGALPTDKALATIPLLPSTPTTETVRVGAPTKRRRAKKKVQPQRINQRVNILLNNQTRTFINKLTN